MARISTHIQDCERILGEGFEEVHRWLDEYAKKYDPMIFLERHRQFRHHNEGVKRVKEKWGFYAERAAKLHLIRDVEMYLPTLTIEIMREDEIDPLYEKALNFCHKPPSM